METLSQRQDDLGAHLSFLLSAHEGFKSDRSKG